jgi:hypothetical protein
MLGALEGHMAYREHISRRRFAHLGAAAAASLGLAGLSTSSLDAQSAPPTAGAPTSLKSEFLMDLILETAPAVTVGNRTIVNVTGGTFEGPKLRGTVLPPGADWPLKVSDTLRVLDVRTLLVTDDNQQIYTTYRGVIYTPPAGQGERYWRTVPAFETAATRYDWLNHVVAVGVGFPVPQRVAYRIFQIL